MLRKALLLAALAAPLAKAADQPKNILFIAVDDLRPALGCYGDPHAQTPNIDRLADRGTVFTNAQCQQAVCAPSRASLMTGLRPDTTRVWDLQTLFRDHIPDAVTLPQYLIAQGYQATGVGKVYDPRSTDKNYDTASWSLPFEHDVECVSDATFHYRDPKQIALVEEKLPEAQAQGIKGWNKIQQFIGRPSTDKADVPDDAYPDGVIAQRGIELIEQLAPADGPFFIAVGFKKPHLPFNAPSKYWDLYDPSEFAPKPVSEGLPEGAPELAFQDSWELRSGYTDTPPEGTPIPDEQRVRLTHGYYACVSYVDAQVGKLLDALDASGEADQTVIVLWGDHGFHLGEHGMFCKHTNYEIATRSPMIFASPDIAPRGAYAGPTEFVDIYPTLCDLAGVPVPTGLDGVSLRSVMEGSDADVKPAAISQYPRNIGQKQWAMGYALRDRRFRYVEWRECGDDKGVGTGPIVAVELYDYQTDPDETRNMADDPAYADILERMQSLARELNVGVDPVAAPKAVSSEARTVVDPAGLDEGRIHIRWRDPDARIAYKQTELGPLELHLFKPENSDAPRPAVLFFHGGGWNNGEPKAFYRQACHLSDRGVIAVSASYRLKSTHDAVAADCVADALDAYRYMVEHADELGIDPRRISVGGGSAGGHLAAMVALTAASQEAPLPAPASALLFNPVLDTSRMGAQRMGAEPTEFSPIHLIKSAPPPSIVFNGSADEITPAATAEAYARSARAAGGRCDLVIYNGEGHSFFNRGACFDDTLLRADAFLVGLGLLD